MGLVIPKDPVFVGKTWNQALDLSKAIIPSTGGSKEGPVKIQFKVKSLGTFKGRQAVTIEMTLKGDVSMAAPDAERAGSPSMVSSMSGAGAFIVDQLTGLFLKSDSNVAMSISMAGLPDGEEQKMKQTIRLASDLIDVSRL